MINTSPIEVAKYIRGIKKSHMSHCGIPGKFLHMISQPVSHSLSKLLNNIFEIGHFPNIWKIAHVTPIYKKGGQKMKNLTLDQSQFYQLYQKFVNQ